MITQRLLRFAFIPLTAIALMAMLFLFMVNGSTPALAADLPEWQQTHGNGPMAHHAMPVTETKTAPSDHQMHQGMMGQDMMDHAQADMGDQMVSMGRRMQMMGMMMQMMGHMQKMMDHMHGMMGGGMMGGGMMGGDMMSGGMMSGDMMGEMMDMTSMHAAMGPMMDQMMTEMHEMHQMHQTMGMDHGAMNHAMPITQTMAVSDTTSAVQPDLTQTVQAGAVEIVASAVNLADLEAATIDFHIALNSHSVAIDIDPAKTATLWIGEVAVTPLVWETTTPQGHHIKGILRFPRSSADGSALLADATEITLVIDGLPDDAEHTFTWAVHAE